MKKYFRNHISHDDSFQKSRKKMIMLNVDIEFLLVYSKVDDNEGNE